MDKKSHIKYFFIFLLFSKIIMFIKFILEHISLKDPFILEINY